MYVIIIIISSSSSSSSSGSISGWLERFYPTLSVCHQPWGCFRLRPHFTSIGRLPQSPDKLGVRFFLHTRQHGTSRRLLLDLEGSDERMRELFDVTKDTRVVLHGYNENGGRFWVQDMVQRLLNRV